MMMDVLIHVHVGTCDIYVYSQHIAAFFLCSDRKLEPQPREQKHHALILKTWTKVLLVSSQAGQCLNVSMFDLTAQLLKFTNLESSIEGYSRHRNNKWIGIFLISLIWNLIILWNNYKTAFRNSNHPPFSVVF